MAEGDSLARLVGFGRELRRRGLPVGTTRIVTFCRAAASFEEPTRDDLYWAGRASLTARREDTELFDEAFERYFALGDDPELPRVFQLPSETEIRREASDEGIAADLGVGERSTAASWRGAGDDEEPEGESALRIVASDSEVLRRKSFADL